jgi:hypothetical protein
VSDQRSGKTHGERIALLERDMDALLKQVNHLDGQLAQNFKTIQEKLQTWDSRWKIALAVVLTAIFASGSGSLSLKNILDILSRLK